MKRNHYWAVGLNFTYDIVTSKPRPDEWGSINGPFRRLAKGQCRAWIANDRRHLGVELIKTQTITARELLAKIARPSTLTHQGGGDTFTR